MKIGLDFDNTIVSYDDVFHLVAVEQGAVPSEVPKTKIAVRDFMRAAGNEDAWTEMQGYVYGMRMADVRPFAGVIQAMQLWKSKGHGISIVSHKTRFPFKGPRYDLHTAARRWIEKFLAEDGNPIIPEKDLNFRETKSEKIDRIAELQCDVFLDDLPEILEAPNFPQSTLGVLFDPFGEHPAFPGMTVRSWDEFADLLNAQDLT